MTPWNDRPNLAIPEPSERRQGHSNGNEHLNLDEGDDVFFDENELAETDPPLYLGHTRWKQTQGTPAHVPGALPATPQADRGRTLHRKTRARPKHTRKDVYYEKQLCMLSFLYSLLQVRCALFPSEGKGTCQA